MKVEIKQILVSMLLVMTGRAFGADPDTWAIYRPVSTNGTEIRSAFIFNDSGGTETIFSQVTGAIVDGVNLSEDGLLSLHVIQAGTLRELLTLEALAAGQLQAVFNQDGNDQDLIVESDTRTHALFVRGSDGRVGIGTSSPGQILDVDGNVLLGGQATQTEGRHLIFNGDRQAHIFLGQDSGSGNTLDLFFGLHSGDKRFVFGHAGGTFTDSNIEANQFLRFSSIETVWNDPGNDVDFRIEGDNEPDLFRIDGGADSVNIGGSSSANLFIVEDNDGAAYAVQVYNAGNVEDRKPLALRGGTDNGSGTTTFLGIFSGDATLQGGIEINSGVVQIFDISGRAAKTDIAPTQRNGTDIVMGVPVVEFRYNGHDPMDPASLHTAAFIAEDLLPFYPDAVNYDSEAVDPSRAYTLARSQLIPILWKFGQEQYERTMALQAMVNELSSQISSMGETMASLIGQANARERNAANGWIEYQSFEHANRGD